MFRSVRSILVLLLIAFATAWAQDRVTLSYLGTAGWEITDGKTVVLIDPYLTRLKANSPNDPVLASDPRPTIRLGDIVEPDTAVIDAHIHRADYILITHTHLDHVLDVPYIARKTGAMVLGTESTANFARASGVPERQILIVKGGEDLDLGPISVRVLPSVHGILQNIRPEPRPAGAQPPVNAADSVRTPSPDVFPADAKPPFRASPQFSVEGGTLAYLVRIGGHQILAFGSMNYIEREVDGLRPDVALVGAMPERSRIYRYTARLMRALGDPPLVLPTHWDRFNVPYDVSQAPAIERLQSFIGEVRAASPHTRVIVPKYFEPIELPATPRSREP